MCISFSFLLIFYVTQNQSLVIIHKDMKILAIKLSRVTAEFTESNGSQERAFMVHADLDMVQSVAV